MVCRYQTASLPASDRGVTSSQLESSSVNDSPCATSPEWNRHAPLGSISRDASVSRTLLSPGLKDIATFRGCSDSESWARSGSRGSVVVRHRTPTAREEGTRKVYAPVRD